VRPFFDALVKGDRAVAKAVLDLANAETRVAVIAGSLREFDDQRTDQACRILDAAFQASQQRVSSGEARLRRAVNERQRILGVLDERRASLRAQLASARRDLRARRDRLCDLEKKVATLEEMIGRLFPRAIPAGDDRGKAAPRREPDPEWPTGANGLEVVVVESDVDAGGGEDRDRLRPVQSRRRGVKRGPRTRSKGRLRVIAERRLPKHGWRVRRIRFTRAPR